MHVSNVCFPAEIALEFPNGNESFNRLEDDI